MKGIPVALFSSRSEAERLRTRLTKAGISAQIHEELWLQKLWFVSRQSAGVRLEVTAEQFQRTEELLEDWDRREGALREAVHCPECQSLLVDYPQFARNSVMTNIAAGLLAETGLLERDFYCQHCHYTWPKESSVPAHVRKHLAPDYFIEGLETARPGSRAQESRTVGPAPGS